MNYNVPGGKIFPFLCLYCVCVHMHVFGQLVIFFRLSHC